MARHEVFLIVNYASLLVTISTLLSGQDDMPEDRNDLIITSSTIQNSAAITSLTTVSTTALANTSLTDSIAALANTSDSATLISSATTTISSNNSSCPEICVCPDYNELSQTLVPVLRQMLDSAEKNYTDDILRSFLLREFADNAEPSTSVLSRINIALLSGMQDPKFIMAFTAARFGVTTCYIKSNSSFILDASTEARLFPQVRYKEAFMKNEALEKPHNNGDGQGSGEPLGNSGIYTAPQLYNISFVCENGARVIITKEASLNRYGRWGETNCKVTTEGVFYTNRSLSLIGLDLTGGTAAWLWNITGEEVKAAPCVDHSSNIKITTDAGTASEACMKSGHNKSEFMDRKTFFPNVLQVKMWNTFLAVTQLSDVLAWFQKASDIVLNNNSLGDFNCSQLLPSPASFTSLTISNNSLTSVPVCVLRSSLIYLTLSHNNITDISPFQYPRFVPTAMMDLLDLSDNSISDVGILTDMNISLLYLAGNRIASLNKLSFNRLVKLGLLDLSRNQLHQLDQGLFKSSLWLQELNLRHNYLQDFDGSVSPLRVGLERLQCKIFLDNNRLSHPPFQANNYNIPDGIYVSALDNPYACDCDMFSYVQATKNSSMTTNYLNRNDMRCQLPNPLRGRPLDELILTDDTCHVVADCPRNCSCLLAREDGVVNVDCTNVQHLQQPESLPDSYPLEVEFQGNEIETTRPLRLQDNEFWLRVVSLNVSGRGLTTVPEFLCEALPKAELMDLSFNNLTSLPTCFQTRSEKWPTLELRLAHNPWSCDCDAVSMRTWLAEMMGGQFKQGVKVGDAENVWCSADTHPGLRVAEWDASGCETISYLPWVVSLAVVLSLIVILGPLLYLYRLQAAVAIHAHLHARPFTRTHNFDENDYDHEALVVHGTSDTNIMWTVNSLIPQTQNTHHRLCIPDRDFSPGSTVAESYANAITRTKATLCLLSLDSVRDEWWIYAFQLARAKYARNPHTKLLVVLLEHVDEAGLTEEVREFFKTNTYISVDDKWFWKKLFYYLPDPPKVS